MIHKNIFIKLTVSNKLNTNQWLIIFIKYDQVLYSLAVSYSSGPPSSINNSQEISATGNKITVSFFETIFCK